MKTKKSIINEINRDIEEGIYDLFPVLSARLNHISEKLTKSIYVINSDSLSSKEIQTLIENDYIRHEDIEIL